MSTGLAPGDAITAARFSIVIDGYQIASFSELVGIVSEVEDVELMESTEKEIRVAKLPGKNKPPKLTFKKGKDQSMEMWLWHEAVRAGDIIAARRSCSLVMYATDGTAVARYYLQNAWPAKVEIGALKAGASEVLMESVTLVCEHIQRVAP